MNQITMSKVVAALPSSLIPNAIYIVRAGTGFEIYVSDATGSVAHKHNTVKGDTGTGISSAKVSYATSTSGTIAPSSWSTSIPSVSTGNYLWTQTYISYTDGTSSTAYSVAKNGNTGATGATGPQGPKGDTGAVGPQGIQGPKGDIGPQGPKGDTGATGAQGPKGDIGATGNGISSVVTTYGSSTSGTTAPTSWGSTIPAVSEGAFLWTKIYITYTNGSNSTSYTVAKQGARGATGPQGPTGATGPQGPKGDTGATGATGLTGPTGNGISSVSTTYASSSSGTTAPTSWGSTIPSVAEGAYLWTRINIAFTNGSNSTSYTVAKQGARGATGAQGPTGATGAQGPKGDTGATGPQGPTGATGATGNGIKSTAITYASSSSGTTAPSSWSNTIPSVSEGYYLWTKTVLTYTNNSTSTSYSVAKQGARGATGATGATGPQGPQGPTGATGPVWCPSVNSNGIMSWTKSTGTPGTYDLKAVEWREY